MGAAVLLVVGEVGFAEAMIEAMIGVDSLLGVEGIVEGIEVDRGDMPHIRTILDLLAVS